MKISAVIVTYNATRKEWIQKCLDSLLNSTLPPNIIVIDNASSDDTVKEIEDNYPTIDLIKSKTNLGFGKANNVGIKKAYDQGADFVFLLNQDAWVEPNTLEILSKTANLNPEYGILSPIHLNGTGTALDYNFSNYISPGSCPGLVSDLVLGKKLNPIYPTKFVNAAAWLISRDCIGVIGGFNPLFTLYGEDDNYLHRAFFHKFKVGIVPNTKIYHDREQRPNSEHFIDPKLMLKRKILVKYCNPLEKRTLDFELMTRKKELLKYMLKFNYKEFSNKLEEYKLIKNLAPEVKTKMSIVKVKGINFLEE